MADISTFPSCTHNNNCSCGGQVHSYKESYAKILSSVQPRHVFEWGPGLNSQMALGTTSVSRVVSVEQDKRWIPDLKLKRHTIIHVRDDSDFYVDLYGCCGFDLFFVDSRRRAECIDKVRLVCDSEAVLCLHDAQRSRYHKALSQFPYVHFLHHGFAVATKDHNKYNMMRAL